VRLCFGHSSVGDRRNAHAAHAVINAPLTLIFTMTFLYGILGWSAFVGMAAMIALIPVPTWVAKLSGAVQKKCVRPVVVKSHKHTLISICRKMAAVRSTFCQKSHLALPMSIAD